MKNFTDKKHYEYLKAKQLTNQINEADLYIVNKSEAKNEFIFNSEKKYFYGYKIKLNEDTYLISYGVKYTPLYTGTFKLIHWTDTYLCIYQRGKGIISKLKTTSSDPIMSGCKEENGIYTIKSFMSVYKVEDTLENKSYFATDSIVKKYTIKGNLFEEIN